MNVPKAPVFSVELNQSLESRMSSFIQWSLNQSYSKDYSTDEVFSLLEEGWQAQKLLWQLRTRGHC